jgi:hypothetical protein
MNSKLLPEEQNSVQCLRRSVANSVHACLQLCIRLCGQEHLSRFAHECLLTYLHGL